MAKAHRSWTILEHGPLIQLQPNLWMVDAEVPGMQLRRKMVIARREDASLVIHNAVALSEEGMAEIEALGPLSHLLVPSAFHRLDAASFRERYPQLEVLCPPAARKKVEQVVEVSGSYQDFPSDPSVQLELLEGLKGAEGVMKVRSEGALSLVFNDALFNVPHGTGVEGFIMKHIGSTGGPRVTRVMRLFFVKDKKALRAHLERLATEPGLSRLVPGHGQLIEVEAAAVLAQVAAKL